MSSSLSMLWENFSKTVLVRGEQRVHRISTSPRIEIAGDGSQDRISLIVESPPLRDLPHQLSSLASLGGRQFMHGGRNFVELFSRQSSINKQFYYFALAVADQVLGNRMSTEQAIVAELSAFADLLHETDGLSIERQLGLVGELLFLELLVGRTDEAALDAWLGPIGEPHDFRVGTREYEVKTTISPQRVHIISSLDQLVPSAGCRLHLVSVVLGPAGQGQSFSLPDKVAFLAQSLASEKRKEKFWMLLEASKYLERDAAKYQRRYIVRRPLGIVVVDSAFPVISRQTIEAGLGVLAPRVEELRYEVNIEGLETEGPSFAFDQMLPH